MKNTIIFLICVLFISCRDKDPQTDKNDAPNTTRESSLETEVAGLKRSNEALSARIDQLQKNLASHQHQSGTGNAPTPQDREEHTLKLEIDRHYVFDKDLNLRLKQGTVDTIPPRGVDLILEANSPFLITEVFHWDNKAVYAARYRCENSNGLTPFDRGWQTRGLYDSDLRSGSIRPASREEVDQFNEQLR